tara:strand:+ start:4249 stop:5328 length:1080 start_codon:yes stop_codon:yes gene_type:complete
MLILHIEDNGGDRVLLSQLIKREAPDWELLQFESFEGVELKLKELNHLELVILLDLGLPGFSELSALEQLLKLNYNVPIIVLTGSTKADQGIVAIKKGAEDYLEKNKLRGDILRRSIEYAWQRSILKRELLEANKTKDRLFSIIGHDLKTPILGILGLIDYLKEQNEPKEEELNDFLTLMRKSAEKASSLLANLLDWSRLQLNRIPFKPKWISPKNTINEILEMSELPIAGKGLSFDIDLPDEVEVYADPEMFACILRNLISNAIKFSYPEGLIEISGKSKGNMFEICVRDYGIGIPLQIKNSLFDGSKTIGREGTMGESSTGLGLMLALGFSKQHGGVIRVESVGNIGSAFYLEIPNL